MQRYDPVRRNRNIGTAKSGHGQNNRLTVAEVLHGKHRFWERIENAKEVRRLVSGRLVRFFVQPTRAGCIHACTIDDLTRLMSCFPTSDWTGIGAVLLRQPRRKEQTLEPVWGRLSY